MKIFATALLVTVCVLVPMRADTHCDTMNGPVIPEAKAALEKGDVTSILKWVKKNDEAELKTAFAKAVAVRAKGAIRTMGRQENIGDKSNIPARFSRDWWKRAARGIKRQGFSTHFARTSRQPSSPFFQSKVTS